MSRTIGRVPGSLPVWEVAQATSAQGGIRSQTTLVVLGRYTPVGRQPQKLDEQQKV